MLWPAAGAAPRSVNDGSLVLRLRYGRVGLLLAGDLEATGEQALVTSGQALASNLLKVPHQGSRTSCSELLLDAVRPTHAVISVGPNSYGHPAPETVARLRARGIDLHRTDLGGMVTYATDGARLRQSAYGRR
ncbi:MAG TPA: hypothetical protein DCZ72_14020 [Armatimonadetes bacterium]|nr:hypothetical protein [Armatimonadota bacterium]